MSLALPAPSIDKTQDFQFKDLDKQEATRNPRRAIAEEIGSGSAMSLRIRSSARFDESR